MFQQSKTTSGSSSNPITEGVIWQQLLLFFFPILFGTFFQQLYNTADAVIVGRFLGKQALAAVGGSTTSIINLLIGFFIGLSSGATVIISQYYGAQKADMVGYAVHTAITASIISGGVLTVVGFFGAPLALQAMGTPEDVLGFATLYIRIYFLGTIPNLIYNIGSGILRAVGDSKRPLYFLMASCFTNIVLDILFVILLQFGIAGAAFATIFSQCVSAFLVIFTLTRTQDLHRLVLSRLGLDIRMLKRIIHIGLPSGLQSSMYGMSNVIIQSSINALGTDTVSAWAAYGKIDAIFGMIVSAFGIAITTFVGQNYGAGKSERVRRGIKVCMGMTLVSTLCLSFVLYNFGQYIFRIFTTDPEVLSIGMHILRFLVPTYVTYIILEIYSSSLKGVGDSWKPMLITMLGVCGLRVLWLLLYVPDHRSIYTVIFSYPLTWTITSVLFLIYLHGFSYYRFRRYPEKQ